MIAFFAMWVVEIAVFVAVAVDPRLSPFSLYDSCRLLALIWWLHLFLLIGAI
ncbi:hypothetical protein AQS8620_01452 [Aquimixticola soesokkakensis]|uniref:Uncharacterized protein n=1 Tax=Aquimixticola soesokkakensis TaxID=1519096 RepID=A0A1Y5SEF1_9RHOB|nr:hypothetical protein [Aquimixticola soesokkakensis]SLN38457.1 hypothetical protein AQS8620_01452 [Aquimixticola soesokkakensis]